jgi:hypothetical protein
MAGYGACKQLRLRDVVGLQKRVSRLRLSLTRLFLFALFIRLPFRRLCEHRRIS